MGLRDAGGSGADASVSRRLMRMWPATMDAHEPWSGARGAAEARVAALTGAAEARLTAARLRTYSLPRRTALAQMRKAMAARLRAARTTIIAGCNAYINLSGVVLDDVGGLQSSCTTLMEAAHAAGLSWILAGQGPGLAAGQAWCAEFVEVSASVHRADVQAQATVLPLFLLGDGLSDKLHREKHASPLLHLLCHSLDEHCCRVWRAAGCVVGLCVADPVFPSQGSPTRLC